MTEYTVSEDGQVGVTWYMRHGATFTKNYQWKTGGVAATDSTPAIPATPVDLTGWTARCQIRTKLKDGTVMQSLLSPGNGITLDALGNIRITVTAAQTTAMYPATKGVFDVELERTSDGFVRNLVGGDVSLAPNVTVDVV